FDSRTATGAGRYTFRLWVDDVTPPAVRLQARTVRKGRPVVITATDKGSGVDPDTAVAKLDGATRKLTYWDGAFRIDTPPLTPGGHRLTFQVSDYQETRNTENVAAVLPNTRRLTATVLIR